MSGDAIELAGRPRDDTRTTHAAAEHGRGQDSSADENTLSGMETPGEEFKMVMDGAGIGERELEALPKDTIARGDDASSPTRPDPPTGIKLFFLLVALVRIFPSCPQRARVR